MSEAIISSCPTYRSDGSADQAFFDWYNTNRQDLNSNGPDYPFAIPVWNSPGNTLIVGMIISAVCAAHPSNDNMDAWLSWLADVCVEDDC